MADKIKNIGLAGFLMMGWDSSFWALPTAPTIKGHRLPVYQESDEINEFLALVQ